MRKIILFVLAGAFLLAGLWSCDPGTAPQRYANVTILEAPVAVLANLDSFYVYRIKADEGYSPDSVVCSFSTGIGWQSFALLDDGGLDLLWGPDFASSPSQDIAANNGTYTRAVNFHTLTGGTAADFVFEFMSYVDGWPDANIGPSVTVSARIPQACSLQVWPQNENFAECFDPIAMEIRVSRDSVDHVDSVQVELLQTGVSNPFRSVLHFQPFSADTTWRAVFNPTMFSCASSTPLANYQLTYSAKTRFGMSATQTVAVASFTNHLPVLSNPILPDTVYRPVSPTQTDTIPVTVDLNDCELAGEIHYYGLLFDRSRDDTLNWSTNPLYYLRDDGLAGDVSAGDGRFTIALTITRSDTLLNNMYYFRFYAIECAPPGDTSAYVLDSMRVIQRFGGAAVSMQGTDFGMGVVNEGIRR